ncbi:MAG: hypothetical protein K2J08_02955 [Ruminococcus sp.]|nr:hypothetical protein [Ruminococcus sp.]
MIKIKDTEYSVDFSFLVFNALIFLVRDSAVIMTFYAVCLIHELGHVMAVYATGGKIKSVIFSCTGVIITPEKNFKGELLVILSGVTANILTYIFCLITGKNELFAMLNLGTAIYNLLPYRQLDGGTAIAILTDGTACERSVNILLTIVKIIFSVFLLFVSVVCGKEFFPIFLASVMLFVSERGIK